MEKPACGWGVTRVPPLHSARPRNELRGAASGRGHALTPPGWGRGMSHCRRPGECPAPGCGCVRAEGRSWSLRPGITQPALLWVVPWSWEPASSSPGALSCCWRHQDPLSQLWAWEW